MKKLKAFEALLIGAVLLCLVSASAFAGDEYPQYGPSSDKPASILVYPYFSSKQGDVSLLSVTNTNADHSVGMWQQVIGEVRIHFFYVNLVSGEGTPDPDDDTCEVTNRWTTLTPNDTFTALLSSHNPEGAVGWCYIVAQDPQTGQAIDFDYLIGDMLVANPGNNFVWSTPAYGFKALSYNEAPAYPQTMTRGYHLLTDKVDNGGNGDGDRTFGGVTEIMANDACIPRGEYQAWPNELLLSSFMEQIDPMSSYLVLMTGLDSDWRVKLKMLYYNDSEEEVSQTRDMRCWIKQPLVHFFPGADDLIPGEGIFGLSSIQTGWGRIDGYRATNTVSGGPTLYNVPLLGMIIQTIGGTTSQFQAAHLLHHDGVLVEENTDWDLTIHGGLD